MLGYNSSKYFCQWGSADNSMGYSQGNEWNPTKRDNPLREEKRAGYRIAKIGFSIGLHVDDITMINS